MLNQNQALESVKSSSPLKNLKNSLAVNNIKSKLYFLMLLTATTGGIVVGNIAIPELIPPAQAQWARKLITFVGGELSDVVYMRAGEALQFNCQGIYGRGFHKVQIFRGSEPVTESFAVNYDGTVFNFGYTLDRGEYWVQIDGRPQPGRIVSQ